MSTIYYKKHKHSISKASSDRNLRLEGSIPGTVTVKPTHYRISLISRTFHTWHPNRTDTKLYLAPRVKLMKMLLMKWSNFRLLKII